MSIELAIGIIIVSILGVFLNPMHVLMPDSVNAVLILGLLIGYLVFVGLIWREQASDERDTVHIQKSGRWSFFVGAAILVVGIIVQASHHDIDPWLLYALSGMVLAKLFSRIFHHFKN